MREQEDQKRGALNTNCRKKETGYGGVGLMVKLELVDFVMEVKRVSPQILSVDMVLWRVWGAICSPLITHVLGQHL